MSHLKRVLWLAAWSVWLWLGFGLYRELPRDLGPVVCSYRLNRDEQVDGFLPGGESFLVSQFGPDDRLPTFQIRSVATGEIQSTISSQGNGINRDYWFSDADRYGLRVRYPGAFRDAGGAWRIHI